MKKSKMKIKQKQNGEEDRFKTRVPKMSRMKMNCNLELFNVGGSKFRIKSKW
jgi:hypothetical protein